MSLPLLFLFVPLQSPPAMIERRVLAMGTELRMEVVAESRAAGLRASELALRALEEVAARLSTWTEESELARLNATPPGERIEISAELFADLSLARRWFLATEGAFDPGVGGLVDAWELRRGGRVPSEAEIRDALVPGGFAALALDAGTAMRAHARLRIEEGGFGKGVGLDAALEALGKAGVQSALLDLGGQFALLGRGERVLAIAHPIERDRPILTVRIDRGSLATSGNGERGIVVDGVRYGHLLDPRTGRPANDFGSVTVWAESASAADCLSTGLFVLGPDRALRFAEEHAGVEVAVVELRPEGPTIRVSRGLEGRIALSRAASAAGVTPYFERRKP